MSVTLGNHATAPTAPSPADHAAAGDAPPATRARTAGWRDPRLWIGVALVAASVVVGARLLASADDTVAVWSVADDVAVGETVGPDDLEARRVRFADEADLARYVGVDDALPADAVATRALGAGELLPAGALGEAGDDGTVVVSVPVDPMRVPGSVGAGSLVRVWVWDAAADRSRAGSDDALALDEVRVAGTPGGDALGGGLTPLELAIPAEQVDGFQALLAGLTDPVVAVGEAG
ncbi:MAG: hypothetical protein CMH83_14085 [Nocardioides sp.]|nr:hypothetical protein [Nocardioides sp.]